MARARRPRQVQVLLLWLLVAHTASTLDSKVLLPYRPYSWLQWLGGLGPLLTSQPQSSQPVLEALVQSVVAALGGATKQKGRR